MTALPHPAAFAGTPAFPGLTSASVRPKVVEHYWGYEVCASEQAVDIAVLMRATCGILTVASFVAALGVWMMPAIVFASSPVAMKAAVSVSLVCLTFMMARIAARGTRVRIQIDTANGELREVVDGPLNTVYVLAQYGFDAVDAVEVVTSCDALSIGQVQIKIKGIGSIPAGVGSMSALHPLRDRLAGDCGVDGPCKPRAAVWTGPLAA